MSFSSPSPVDVASLPRSSRAYFLSIVNSLVENFISQTLITILPIDQQNDLRAGITGASS